MDGMVHTVTSTVPASEGVGITHADVAEAVRASALLADLSISTWSGEISDKKVVDKLKEDANALGNVGRFNKNLLAGADTPLKNLCARYNEARTKHYELTLPWSSNPHAASGARGPRLLPTALFMRYAAEMGEIRKNAEAQLENFLAGYDELVTQAQANLAGLANPAEYPTADEVRKRFKLSYEFTPIPPTGAFRGLPDMALAALDEALRRRQKHAVAAAQRAMWSRVRELITPLRERLDDPEAPRFKSALVENVRGLITLLPGFNTMGDARVSEIVRDLEVMLSGVDAETIRKDAGLRAVVAQRAGALIDKLNQWSV